MKKKWQMLGRFAYHHNKITLVATEDEREYEVRIWEGIHHRHKVKNPKPTQVHPFSDLRPARTAFENAVQNLVLNTSYTDVSIYMQQQAGLHI